MHFVSAIGDRIRNTLEICLVVIDQDVLTHILIQKIAVSFCIMYPSGSIVLYFCFHSAEQPSLEIEWDYGFAK